MCVCVWVCVRVGPNDLDRTEAVWMEWWLGGPVKKNSSMELAVI